MPCYCWALRKGAEGWRTVTWLNPWTSKTDHAVSVPSESRTLPWVLYRTKTTIVLPQSFSDSQARIGAKMCHKRGIYVMVRRSMISCAICMWTTSTWRRISGILSFRFLNCSSFAVNSPLFCPRLLSLLLLLHSHAACDLGASIYDVHNILGFFGPLPPVCRQNIYSLSAN